jgi:isoleucyl-tRNA synthetase
MHDFIESEEKILSYWKDNQINNKVKSKNINNKPFYFLDGPPYVTGYLHPAHIWTKTIKDIFVRYKRYRGFEVVDRAGYDVHGLPIENKVEKELKITSKKEIESVIGVENFVKECKNYVDKYIGSMDADYDRYGISLNFKDPYLPHSNQYIETAWSIFKNIADKNYLYKGRKTLIYCPHCETSLSQGSMEVEYKNDEDPSIFITFKIIGKSDLEIPADSFLAIWTTTPWTLPANVAVAVNPKERYVLAKIGQKRMIVVKARLDALAEFMNESATIEKEFYGSEMKGLHYINPLENKVKMQKTLRKYHKIIMSEELVSIAEGTGLVHIAPGHGIEDFALGQKNRLPAFSPVAPDATYTEEAGEFKGLKVPAEANKVILQNLEELGVLLYRTNLVHSYPHCWRCDSKLIFISTDQWFLNIKKIKSKLIRNNKKIKWHPEEVMKWQEDILKNSPDWCISRQRYWGIPMPVWTCKSCGAIKVIGSVEELKGYSINKLDSDNLSDLHRPYIDKIKLRCECGGEMERITDILDVWFDSGIAFRASLTNEEFIKLFPIELVVEYIEQIRGWFQYVMKIGEMAYGKQPFKHIIVHGIMFGLDGRKMSKSFGNYRPLNEMTKFASADAFRLYSVSHLPLLNRNLDETEIKNAEKVIMILRNISDLAQEYKKLLNVEFKEKISQNSLSDIDKWIISKVESLNSDVTKYLEDYDSYNAAIAIRKFIVEDFSRFYLKLAKKEMQSEKKAEAKKVMQVILYVLNKVIITSSVIIPFVSEEIYLDIYHKKESVFLEEWPKVNKKYINKKLEEDMEIIQDAITAILNSREIANIPIRQPLAKAYLDVTNETVIPSLEKLSVILEEYTNIRKIEIKSIESVDEEIKPVFGEIGPAFKGNAGMIAEELKKADSKKVIEEFSKNGYYILHTQKGTFEIKPNYVFILKKVTEKDSALFKYGKARVDPEIDEELKKEALIREFERGVQMLRKNMKLVKTDTITVGYNAFGELEKIISENEDRIKKDIGAKRMSNKIDLETNASEFEIDSTKVKVSVKKE